MKGLGFCAYKDIILLNSLIITAHSLTFGFGWGEEGEMLIDTFSIYNFKVVLEVSIEKKETLLVCFLSKFKWCVTFGRKKKNLLKQKLWIMQNMTTSAISA